jgi:branched-chain amino acid transport system ATP-binding protein
MSILEVEGVSSYYDDFQALYDLSLSVEAGETMAIIGANGAGKSTLLNVISGLVPNRSGSVRFDGQAIDRLPAHARVELGISLVPEGRRVFPSLTVRENLLIGAYRKRSGPWAIDTVFELFPLLRERSERSAAVLSGGEQQALAIGRALMANPRLLLLDEVSLGLAPVVVNQLYAGMSAIVAAGTTILLVEQNVEQALQAARTVYCLLEGRISLSGRTAELSRDAIVTAYFGI